jgi:hypothetical protein
VIEPDPEAAVAYGLFSVRQAKDAGYGEDEIRRQVRRGRWQQVERTVLQVAGREARSGDRYVRDVLCAGPRAVSAFASAAVVHGWDLDVLPPTPAVILPPGTRGRGQIVSQRSILADDEIVVMGVLRVTTPLRTAVDLASVLPPRLAVITLDCAFRSRWVHQDELALALSRGRGHGVSAARRALALSDPLSGSIPETIARLLFLEAGLPTPIAQYPVRWGDLVARLDFAWPEHMLLVEIDGRRWHIDADTFAQDRVRQNAATQNGWRILRFTAAQVRFHPEYVVAEVRRALGY